tara:strand:+ start:759 stop:1727 length:969 start_codon:yes stop_codon:yes gene_type:complete
LIRGLVLGKFLPPHKGHLHLISEALKQCDELTVVVGSLQREPIPGELRFQWMKELCNCSVVHLTDENPQFPEEHPDFWRIWKASLQRVHPEPVDVLFSSEDYGDRLASELGARHICVDLARKVVPVSGTAIREKPLSHYQFLPDPVRPYFHRKIVITGAESTGKTITSRHLANRFHTTWAHEYAREYLDSMGRFVQEEDIEQIGMGQIALEDRVRKQANRVFFCDTDLMATVIYSNHYFGDCPSFIPEALSTRIGDFYLFMDIDIPWVEDPQRDAPHLREEFRSRFLGELERSGAEYRIIKGNFHQRLERAVDAVDNYLSNY